LRKAIYILPVSLLSLLGAFSLCFSIYTLLNHFFYFNPTKIAVEFETSMLFAGGHFAFSAINLSIAFIIYGRYKKQKNV